jgi:hypothetical protein
VSLFLVGFVAMTTLTHCNARAIFLVWLNSLVDQDTTNLYLVHVEVLQPNL